MPEPTTETPTLHLARWTVTSGSNARSRGAVIIDAGDHHWRASADGNGTSTSGTSSLIFSAMESGAFKLAR